MRARMTIGRARGLLAAVLLVATLPAAATADAPANHVVQVGAVNPDNANSTYNYTRFYPERIQVARGDSVTWRWGAAGYFGWHSVTFLPGDMDVAAHPHGVESAYPDAFRADELGVALNEEWVTGHDGSPTGASPCGRGAWRNLPAQTETCTLSSTGELLSSSISDTFLNMTGAPQNVTWTATIDLSPGTYRYRCLFHPSMNGEVQVLADDARPEMTPEEIQAQTARQIAEDTAAADAVFQDRNDPTRAFDPDTGTWTVHVGAETPDGHVAIYSFLPTSLTVPAGAVVRYVAGMDEPNTVMFPPDAKGTFGPPHQGCTPSKCGQGVDAPSQVPGHGLGFLAFPFVCEQDDPVTGLPGVPAFLTRATWACASGNLEWGVAPYMATATVAPDGEVATRATFHNSGMLMEADSPAWYAGPFDGVPRIPATFDARFPNKGTFPYACIAHADFMTGNVSVE